MEKQAENRGNPLGWAPVVSLMVKFAVPTIISMLVISAYNMTDQIFIGNKVGMLGNAATNVAFPVVMFIMAFSQLCGVGTAANFNLKLGAGRDDEAQHYITTGITLLAIIGIIVMAFVLLLKEPILRLCGATDLIMPYASDYLGITGIGLPFVLFGSASAFIIRGDGSPNYAMFCTVSGAVINIILDWLFVFPLDMGIRGAAIATVIGQVISCLLSIYYYTRFKTCKIHLKDLGIKPRYAADILRIGVPNFINHMIMVLVTILLNNAMKVYGAKSVYGSEIPLAVSGIVMKINGIVISFAVGLAIGCQPIHSFNKGAGNYHRMKETFIKALIVSVILGFIFFLLFQLFPRPIISIFGSGSEEYFRFGERFMRIFLFMLFAFGVQPISVNYFTASGNVRSSLILSLSRQGFLFVPLVLILPLFWGIDGVLYSAPIADALAAALALIMVRADFKKLDKLKAAETAKTAEKPEV